MAPEEIHATAVPQDRREAAAARTVLALSAQFGRTGVCVRVSTAPPALLGKPYLTYRGGMSVNHPRPKAKLSRALGIPLTPKCVKYFEQRPYPPGDHGRARKSTSDYKVRLLEKQRLRYQYNVSETQLALAFDRAHRSSAKTGEALVVAWRPASTRSFCGPASRGPSTRPVRRSPTATSPSTASGWTSRPTGSSRKT